METHPRLNVPDCFGCKVSNVKFHTVKLRIQNASGMTGNEMAKENRENFKRDKGYYPESAKRWI